MTSIRETIRRIFETTRPLPAGTYHYQAPADSPTPLRLHLRLEADGTGLLIVNASTVLHLNPTAAEFAYHLVQQTPEEEVVRSVSRRYNVQIDQARADFKDLSDRLRTFVTTPDLDPETYLSFERADPYSVQISAPYRLDCALTYRLSSGDPRKDAPIERVRREMLTEEWQTILQKAWDAGIPHVIFTGGEPTLRPDLPDLIRYAESLGLVSGLISDGLRLAETEFLHTLLQSGLDHLMLILHADEEESWEALRDVLSEDLFTTVHVTLTPHNVNEIPDILEKLAQMGVTSLSLSVSTDALTKELQTARQTAAERGLSLKWDLPVPYSDLHPVALELQQAERPVGAGKAWLYVEPDGDVLPAQGVTQTLGNMLVDPWEEIWRKAQAG
ncbi:MAG: PqqD family peptide modification chaperone [Anaerolineaceae bacterium]